MHRLGRKYVKRIRYIAFGINAKTCGEGKDKVNGKDMGANKVRSTARMIVRTRRIVGTIKTRGRARLTRD